MPSFSSLFAVPPVDYDYVPPVGYGYGPGPGVAVVGPRGGVYVGY